GLLFGAQRWLGGFRLGEIGNLLSLLQGGLLLGEFLGETGRLRFLGLEGLRGGVESLGDALGGGGLALGILFECFHIGSEGLDGAIVFGQLRLAGVAGLGGGGDRFFDLGQALAGGGELGGGRLGTL